MSYIVRQSYMVNNKVNILIKQGLPLSDNALLAHMTLLFLRTDHNRIIIQRLIPLFPRLLYTDLTTTWFLWSQWISGLPKHGRRYYYSAARRGSRRGRCCS